MAFTLASGSLLTRLAQTTRSWHSRWWQLVRPSSLRRATRSVAFTLTSWGHARTSSSRRPPPATVKPRSAARRKPRRWRGLVCRERPAATLPESARRRCCLACRARLLSEPTSAHYAGPLSARRWSGQSTRWRPVGRGADALGADPAEDARRSFPVARATEPLARVGRDGRLNRDQNRRERIRLLPLDCAPGRTSSTATATVTRAG